MRVLEQTARGVRGAGGTLGGLDAAPDDEARDEPGEIERDDDHVEQVVYVHEHVPAQALEVDLLALGGQDACEATASAQARSVSHLRLNLISIHPRAGKGPIRNAHRAPR